MLHLQLGGGDKAAGMSIALGGLECIARKVLKVFSGLKDKLQRQMVILIPR